MNKTISENFSKNKQGRPRIISKDELELNKRMWPDIKSERGIIEISYMVRAYHIIKKEYNQDKLKNSWCEYYIDKNLVYVFHKSILAALGRCCEEEILGFGRIIAEEHIPATTAIKFIRRNRSKIQ